MALAITCFDYLPTVRRGVSMKRLSVLSKASKKKQVLAISKSLSHRFPLGHFINLNSLELGDDEIGIEAFVTPVEMVHRAM